VRRIALTPEADLIEAVNDLISLLESETRPKLQIRRDKAIAGPSRVIQKLARSRFRSQLKAVLQSHALRNLTHLKEAETEAEARKRVIDEATLTLGPVIYHQPVTAVDSLRYDTAIRAAIQSGAEGAAEVLASTPANPESFIAEYLKSNGFTKLTGEIDKTTVDRIATAIADAYEEGADFDATVKAVRAEFADMTANRAKMIATTELNDAFNSSIVHFGREAGATMKSWEIEPGACIVCVGNALAGEIPLEDLFPSGDDQPTAHPNCFLGGTLVSSDFISAATRRRYEGDIFVLSVTGSPDLSVTPNHPILTRSGWVPVCLLQPGDDVLQRVLPSDSTALRIFDGGNPDNYDAESSIEKVFDALVMSRGVTSASKPTTSEAFHGDPTVNNEVDIINSLGDLSFDSTEDGKVFDDFVNSKLASRKWDITADGLASPGALRSFFGGVLPALGGGVGGGGVSLPLLGSQFGVADELGSTSAALLEPHEVPMTVDRDAADSDSIGDGENALPFQVRPVKILKIERRKFSGHVYNLETKSGFYLANSIVVHNCMCSLLVHA